MEAVQAARDRDLKVGAMKITTLFPYHEDLIRAFMKRCKEILIPELNFGGQLADLIGRLHGKDVIRMNRATGVPIAPSLILKEIETLVMEGGK